jgi:hypothetical protein
VPDAAIQDIARYQEQLLKMLLHHDDRALKVLSLYVTVLAALVTAAFALNQAQALNAYAKIFMGGGAVSLAVGCGFAYRAAWKARIYLPGRKADFWSWALGVAIEYSCGGTMATSDKLIGYQADAI